MKTAGPLWCCGGPTWHSSAKAGAAIATVAAAPSIERRVSRSRVVVDALGMVFPHVKSGRLCEYPFQVALFDHLVRRGEERRGDGDAERLRSLQIDHQLELGWVLDRQVGGVRALQAAVDIGCRTTKQVRLVDAVRHQPAHIGEVAVAIERWQ